MAVMVWVPVPSALVAKVAMPPAMVPTPRGVLASRKGTVPVGVPGPEADGKSVVEGVTGGPAADGLTDEISAVVVVVAALEPTGCASGGEVLPLKVVSPP